MSKTKETTPLMKAISLLESERVESPQTDMDRLNNEIIGRLVIRLGALKGMEREFAKTIFFKGEMRGVDSCSVENGWMPSFLEPDFDTFYSKFEG